MEWVWLTIGCALLAAELVTGTFIIVFFGFGAILTAIAALIGLSNLSFQITFFAVMSLIFLFAFRKKFLKHREGKSTSLMSSDVHKTLSLSEDIPAGGQATVNYQGSPWTAVNVSSEALTKGSLAKIVKVDGIKLFVAPVNSLEDGLWKLSQ